MPEMERRVEDTKIAVFGPDMKENVYRTPWIFGTFISMEYLWKMLLESKILLSNNFIHTNLVTFL